MEIDRVFIIISNDNKRFVLLETIASETFLRTFFLGKRGNEKSIEIYHNFSGRLEINFSYHDLLAEKNVASVCTNVEKKENFIDLSSRHVGGTRICGARLSPIEIHL